MEVIEGYYMRMRSIIFYAKGIEHPPGKVVAYPKYVLDPRGDRRDRRGRKFRKLPTQDEQLEYLKSCCREYLVDDPYIGERVPEIPLSSFDEIYDPLERAQELLAGNPQGVEREAVQMILDLGPDNIGISGSILVGLHNESSDIDLVVYGEEEGRRIYETLRKKVEEGVHYRKYSEKDSRALYERRIRETPLSWYDFMRQERRRILEGYYRGREYSIRLVRPESSYGSKTVRKVGEAQLLLEITDSEESIFTPCIYGVRVLEVSDGPGEGNDVSFIYSLRERFTEIASEGDVVEARGKVEVWNYIGTGRKATLLYLGERGDYMRVLN